MLFSVILSSGRLPGVTSPTVHAVAGWVALGLGIASFALPIALFLRRIIMAVRRRSPLGYGMGIGLLIGSGINLALLVALGWYLWNNPTLYPA